MTPPPAPPSGSADDLVAVYRQIENLHDHMRKMERIMIDPREFGRLEADVAQLKVDVNEMRRDLKTLLDMASRGKGVLWLGIGVASTVGGAATYLADRLWK